MTDAKPSRTAAATTEPALGQWPITSDDENKTDDEVNQMASQIKNEEESPHRHEEDGTDPP